MPRNLGCPETLPAINQAQPTSTLDKACASKPERRHPRRRAPAKTPQGLGLNQLVRSTPRQFLPRDEVGRSCHSVAPDFAERRLAQFASSASIELLEILPASINGLPLVCGQPDNLQGLSGHVKHHANGYGWRAYLMAGGLRLAQLGRYLDLTGQCLPVLA